MKNILICILALILVSCSAHTAASHFDQNIPAPDRAEADRLDALIWDVLNSGDPKGFHELVTSDFPLEKLPPAIDVKTEGEVKILRQARASMNVKGTGGVVPLLDKFSQGPVFQVNAFPEVMVSVTERASATEPATTRMKCVYRLEKGDWKLFSFRTGYASWYGKDSQEWLEEVKALSKSGKSLATFVTIRAIGEVFQPLEGYNEPHLAEVQKILKDAVAVLQPLVPFDIKVKGHDLTVYQLNAGAFRDASGPTPIIVYIHPLGPEAGEELRPIARALHAELLKREHFKELADFKVKIYRGYAEPPTDPKKQYPLFGTVIED